MRMFAYNVSHFLAADGSLYDSSISSSDAYSPHPANPLHLQHHQHQHQQYPTSLNSSSDYAAPGSSSNDAFQAQDYCSVSPLAAATPFCPAPYYQHQQQQYCEQQDSFFLPPAPPPKQQQPQQQPQRKRVLSSNSDCSPSSTTPNPDSPKPKPSRSMGRKKIQISRIGDERNRQVRVMSANCGSGLRRFSCSLPSPY